MKKPPVSAENNNPAASKIMTAKQFVERLKKCNRMMN